MSSDPSSAPSTHSSTDPAPGAPTGPVDVRALLDERYGRRGGGGRPDRRIVAAAAVGISVAVGLLLWTALHAATPPVGTALLGYQVRDASSVEVRFEVRRDPSLAVRCLLRAQDSDNVTVGRLRVDVPTGAERTVAMAAVVPTTRLAINGELEECTASGGE